MKTLIGFASLAAVLAAVLFLHGAGGSSSASPFSVSAAMAAAKCPDITDTNTHPLPYGALPTASLDARTCAIDFGIPAGAPGAAGAAGAQGSPGAPGVSGYSAVSKVAIGGPKSSNYRMSKTATCPRGKKAIGGGASFSTDGGKSFPNVAITASEPTPNGQGWTAAIALGAQGEGTINVPGSGRRVKAIVKVTAICAMVTG